MDPITQAFIQGAAGAAGGKPYVDDVFSTYAYYGNSTEGHVINNGIDLAGEGGLVWVKKRSGVDNHVATHVPGTVLFPNTTGAASTGNTNFIESFNSNGFTLGGGVSGSNASGETTISWTWRKAPGFFDVVTYTGNGVAGRQVPHNLGSKPGVVIVKCISSAGEWWYVYHKDLGATKHLKLDATNAAGTNAEPWNNTEPTSTHFTLAEYNSSNGSGKSYVAYLFAGGESTAATATSCNFLGAASDAQDNKIWVGNASDKTSDFVYGTGDFTMEAWFNPVDSSNAYKRIIHHGHEWNQNNTVALMWDHTSYNNTLTFWSYALNSSNPILISKPHAFQGSWNHVAVTRSSGTFRLFVNGVLESTNTSLSGSIEGSETSNYVTIGATHNLNQQECFRGNISNVRIVKGTAVYTSSFRPSYEPLTNITNTKLLCCNGSTTTSATVTPKTLVSDSTVTINTTNSPFDDPEGFKFGEEENENLIKTGSYIGFGGGGSGSHVDVDLGWEPQWVLIKNSSATSGWNMFDSMRGTPTGLYSEQLSANTNAAENNYSVNQLDFTSRGFRINIEGNSEMNQADSTHVYIAIRRPDGYVGKPAKAGTDVFAMDAGKNSLIPNFDSGFPVDYLFTRDITSNGAEMYSTGRLAQKTFLVTQTTAADSTSNAFTFDSNEGACTTGLNSTFQAWMWKRGQGMDVVTYKGNGTSGHRIPHSLSKVPEMIWIKNRDETRNWPVYHKGLNEGTDPADHYIYLNGTGAQQNDSGFWNDTMPTSTDFTLGSYGEVNNSQRYIAMLFASVAGISKVGYYTGNGTGGSSTQTITTGFQPRFIIIKKTSGSDNWLVFDTVRGWAAGNDKALKLNSTDAQNSGTWDVGEPTSTGFTLVGNFGTTNASGGKYIYYAHA